jgi:hypothetical protein
MAGCDISKTLELKVFCFEAYKREKKLTGRETMALFKKYGVLEYIDSCYDALCTQGRNYLVRDIEEFIKIRS